MAAKPVPTSAGIARTPGPARNAGPPARRDLPARRRPPPKQNPPPGQPRLALRGHGDRRPDVLQTGITERLEHRSLHHAGHEPAVRSEQHVPDVLGTSVARVTQREVQTVYLRVRIESVEPALVPAELDGDDHVPA